MPVNAALMRTDYSSLGRVGENLGRGVAGVRMRGDQDLAGKALMLDPMAMQELQQRNPMMAAEVQGKLAEQQAAQNQAQMESNTAFANEMKEAFNTFGKANTPEEFATGIQNAINQGMFPQIAQRIQDSGETIDVDDFLTAKLMTNQMDDETFDQAMKLRNETKPYVQQYTDAKGSLNTLLNVTQQDASPTDQLAAVFSFMKSLDPGSVVREGEQVMVKRTDGIFGVMGNYINQLMTGQALNKDQLANLQRTGLKGFEGRARALSDQIRFQTGVAGDFGIDSSLVAPGELLNIDETLKSYEQRLSPESGSETIVISGGAFGDVSEADIQKTMEEEGLTREQVINMISGGQ